MFRFTPFFALPHTHQQHSFRSILHLHPSPFLEHRQHNLRPFLHLHPSPLLQKSMAILRRAQRNRRQRVNPDSTLSSAAFSIAFSSTIRRELRQNSTSNTTTNSIDPQPVPPSEAHPSTDDFAQPSTSPVHCSFTVPPCGGSNQSNGYRISPTHVPEHAPPPEGYDLDNHNQPQQPARHHQLQPQSENSDAEGEIDSENLNDLITNISTSLFIGSDLLDVLDGEDEDEDEDNSIWDDCYDDNEDHRNNS